MTTYALAGTVAAGESVTVIENSASGFLYIEYSSSNGTKRGYIQSDKLEEKKRGKLGQVRKEETTCSVYNGPDDSLVYPAESSVFGKEYVVVLDQIERGQYNRAWYYIDFNAKYGRKRGYIPQESITDIRGSGAILSERKGSYIARGSSQESKINLFLVRVKHISRMNRLIRERWSVFLKDEHMNQTMLKLSTAQEMVT